MVQNYLEGIRQDFLGRKDELKTRLDSLYMRQKEIQKFLQVLEEKSDPNYDAFSPRKKNSFRNLCSS